MNVLLLKTLDRLVGSLLVRILGRPASANLPPSSVGNILLIRPGGIGDAVLMVPLLSHLRQFYPNAVIDVLAERRNAEAFTLSDVQHSVYCYDRLRELSAVINHRYDLVIDTEQWHRLSAVVGRILRPKYLIGFGTNDRKHLFHACVGYSQDDYEAASFLKLLGPLMGSQDAALTELFLAVPRGATVVAEGLLKEVARPFVSLFPGASIRERQWGGGKFANLAKGLSGAGFSVIVVGGKGDQIVGEEIAAVAPNIYNFAGKTSLTESAALLSPSSCLVTGDSGLMHVAVGLGVPTVSLFGPGRRKKWAPRGKNHMVLDHQLECSPCTTFGTTPRCKKGGECMADIGVDEVLNATLGLLSAKASMPCEGCNAN